MERRKLEELNLLDDFLFGSMVTHPEVGEKFVREILKTIFGKSFGKLTVVPQKVYYGADTDKHGARLDVYLEESPPEKSEDIVAVYDMEPDKNNDTAAIKALPRRVRFYHAMIDGNSLNTGENYKKLKNVFIILITPYDPLAGQRMVYTILNMCEEMPSLPYEDGARTIFLYTKGTEGNPSPELRELLYYMENTTEENAVNDSVKRIHRMVNQVKHDKEVSLNYMKTFEWEEMLIKQGQEQGRLQGQLLEQANTERERIRANHEAEKALHEAARADHAERELIFLKKKLAEIEAKESHEGRFRGQL